MGFSTIAYMTAFLSLILLVAYSLSMTAGDQQKSLMELRDYGRMAGDNQRSSIGFIDFNCTNITSNLMNVTLYFENNGSTPQNASCIDVLIDGQWVRANNKTTHITPTTFDPWVWNPSETLNVHVFHSLVVGEHNATVISCLGNSQHLVFNASKCGDGTCHGGEFCDRDNSSCPDNICYEPKCYRGCIEIPYIEDEDIDECDSTGDGCPTDGCICNVYSVCCGETNSHGCTGSSDCCSNLCQDGRCVSGISMGIPPQSCEGAEEEVNPDSFPDACGGTYPEACGGGDDELSCDDNQKEEFDAEYTEYCGLKAEYYNASVIECQTINWVQVCHETWLESAAASDCDISVSRDGSSWVEVNTTCNLVKDSGLVCQDVSSAYSWACGDFFGSSGSFIRYNAQNQEDRKRTCATDALYYLVEFAPTSGVTVNIPPQSCEGAGEEVNPDSFPDACGGTYPEACGGGDDELLCDDNQKEEFDAEYTEYCGLKAEYYNATLTGCNSINRVQVCHETWLESAAASDCDISVSRDGSSWVEVNTTCNLVKDSGLVCQDVSSAYSWACGDFFGSSGSFIRYNAQNQEDKKKKCKTDVLYYRVRYE